MENFGSGLKIVIVNGRPCSGKTTFEEICKELMGEGFCESCSTVSLIKHIASIGGWNGEKDEKSRKFLSDLKDLFTEYNDAPLNHVCQVLKNWDAGVCDYGLGAHPHIFFIDDREPEHIDRLKHKLGAITLLIRRPGDENIEISNHADALVFDYTYDYVIMNDGDLEQLKMRAAQFINLIFQDN